MNKELFEKLKGIYLNRKQRALIMWATLLLIGVVLIPVARLIRAQEYYPANKYAGEIPVLCYHCIDEPQGPEEYQYEYVTPEDFEKQLKWLSNNGYVFIDPSEIEEKQKAINSGDKTKYIMISFDDGYDNNYAVTELLKKYDAKATLFMIASKIGATNRLTANDIKSMSDSGYWTIGSHSYSHRILAGIDSKDLDYELSTSKSIIESITGKEVTAISYPDGQADYLLYNLSKKYYSQSFLSDPDGNYGYHRQVVFGYLSFTKFKALIHQYY